MMNTSRWLQQSTVMATATLAIALTGGIAEETALAQDCGSDLFSQAGCLLKSVTGDSKRNTQEPNPDTRKETTTSAEKQRSITDLVPTSITDYIKVTPPKAIQQQPSKSDGKNQTHPGLPSPGPTPAASNKLADLVPGMLLNTPGFDLGFGVDNRIPMTSTEYPWNTIGRVELVGGGHCTGSLIRRDLVITNAHCTGVHEIREPDKPYQCLAPDARPKLVFKLGFNDGKSIDTVAIEDSARALTRGTACPGMERNNDWAIFKLARPVNNGNKWMETRVESLAALHKKKIIYVGYSTFKQDPRPEIFKNGKVAGVDDSCSLVNYAPKTGNIFHNCDMGRGGSGGPAFAWENNQAILLAVNAAEHRDGATESFWTEDFNINIDDIMLNKSKPNIAVPLISFQEILNDYLAASDKSQYIVHQAKSGIGGPWGDWNQAQFCPAGTKATGYTQEVQGSQGGGREDWSMSNFFLLCSGTDSKTTGTAGSHSYASAFRPGKGTFCPSDTCKNPGDHYQRYSKPATQKCPTGQWITAFALKVESNQGTEDDTAANSAKIRCSGGQELEANNAVHWGDSRWGPWQSSPIPNSYVCGARSKVERQGQRDETALNDIELYWCQ